MCANVRIIGRLASIYPSRVFVTLASSRKSSLRDSVLTALSYWYRHRFRQLVLLARDISHGVEREAAPRRGIGGLRLHPWRIASVGPGAARTFLGTQASLVMTRGFSLSLSVIWFSNNALYAEERGTMHLLR